MYEKNDKAHYEYFDYLDVEGVQQQYEPDSDMDFLKFKETMMDEWADYKAERSWIEALLQA